MKRLFMISVVALSTCIGCHSFRKGDVESVVNTFHQAHQTHDWETVRSMVASPLREEKSAAQWSKENEKFTIVSWKIIRVEPTEAITNQTGKTFKTVKVPMDMVVKQKDDPEPRKLKGHTDYWMLVDGKWQWYYTGYPVD